MSPANPVMYWRRPLAGSLEIVGLLLFATLLWRVIFVPRAALDALAIGTGLIGVIAAALKRRQLRTPLDGALAIYLALTLLSAFLNRARFVPVTSYGEAAAPWQPAVHAGALVLFFYGVQSLLAARRRLGVLVTAIVAIITVFGLQAAYDHLLVGFGIRLTEYPSLPIWTGYAGIGLLFAVAFPLPLPLLIVNRRAAVLLAGVCIVSVLMLDLVGIYSRAATASAVAAYIALSAVEVWKFKSFRLPAVGLVALTCAGGLALRSVSPHTLLVFLRGDFYSGAGGPAQAYTIRALIWIRAAGLIRTHPWIGVGPGNYSDAMHQMYDYLKEPYSGFYTVHAHSTLLNVAAESGVPALIAFLVIWWRLAAGLLRRSDRSHAGVLAMGLLGVLVMFFTRSLTDHFFSGLDLSNRITYLLWIFFAASVAVIQLPEKHTAARSA